MNNKGLWSISGGLALLSGFMLWQYTAALEDEMGTRDMVSVVVAEEQLAEGEVLTGEQVTRQEFPSRFLHPHVVRGTDLDSVLGRTLGTALEPGQPLLWSDFSGGRNGPSRLVEIVPRGKRALTLPVDPRLALGGMVHPGDRVDVLLTYTTQESRRTTRTLLQAIQVAAVGTRIRDTVATNEEGGDGDERESDVTLLLDPTQAELVAYAVERGTLALTLRNPADQEAVTLSTQEFGRLLGDEPPPAKAVDRVVKVEMPRLPQGPIVIDPNER